MKLVIDISESDYCRIKDIPDAFDSLMSRAYKSIKNGTPLHRNFFGIDFESLAKTHVDIVLHETTIEIAGEGKMPLMEFLDKVGSGDFYVIRKEDTQIKPIPYEGEEEIKRAYDRGYNQACKDKIDAPYKEAEWLPQYEGEWVAESEAEE